MFVRAAATDVGEGHGLSTIGVALSHFPPALLFLASGLMIWVSARE